ncbi:nicotinate phosphoribosyltransferase, related [Neospora caninum Liverpool]|uniref:Nicotinate phosphoribosyltransferase n=1 Tax=Neospora caninum (strain Liverpool) TaxID=572307 RepID=F0V7Y9_NEOCL|nr:nicotinate phosphoribosyltransferase, related [Neospora caninum Liverpool]CBZ49830.1 nicotinate phosphoribosyltransferase, related [Neospora caninum Liverpool]CEL64419.1 TPA: Nicotinate phosphoribosyltransferase, related [Neospora caninum Liverpool]|eukprot:XP_003879865.1 nicotinate phosphoribosyltransferase, related [Neospora caninum Liverpool]
MEKNQQRVKRRLASAQMPAHDGVEPAKLRAPAALDPCSPSLMLTDWYQFSMLYANWEAEKHHQHAVFEGFFRKAPFQGEFAVMAGVKQVVEFISRMRFTEEHIAFFRTQFPHASEEFFDYLRSVDCSDLCLHAIPEGTIVFPKVPLIRIEGPLAICQLIETAVLNILNFAILVATNAARHRLAAGWDKVLLEFGARRAQGPDGALSASRYAYLGGFDGTSNTQAAYLFNIPLKGTMAHSFVTSFSSFDQLKRDLVMPPPTRGAGAGEQPEKEGGGASAPRVVLGKDLIEQVLKYREKVVALWPAENLDSMMNMGELAAFTAFAQTFPNAFLALVDTYDTLYSGVPNALVVSAALLACGYQPCGVRLDSGDLACLSRDVRRLFHEAAAAFEMPALCRLKIAASNDLNEVIISSVRDEGHEIDIFAVGTNLVTCQAQPALGMVYKLVELEGNACMKVSQVFEKASLPCKKEAYRLFTKDGSPAVDLLQEAKDPPPAQGERIFCRHLYDDRKRCFLVPSNVKRLLQPYISRGKLVAEPLSLEDARAQCISGLRSLRKDLTRLINPTPFKVSASEDYFTCFHRMWQGMAPVRTYE